MPARRERPGAPAAWTVALGIVLGIGATACETPDMDLPGPAVDHLDGTAPVPEELLPRNGADVERVAIGAEGETVYGSLRASAEPEDTRLVQWSWDGERWAGPEPLPFSPGGTGDGEINVAPDGSYLLFSSLRETGQVGAGDRNLWLSQTQDEGEGEEWSDPWMVPVIHSPAWDGGPALSMTGDLYFSSERDDDAAGRDLYVSRLDGQRWAAPQGIEAMNSSADEVDPWVAPDQSFLLFASDRDGAWNLYISFSEDEGETWTDPDPLQPPVASDADERAPALSPAGEVLFFVRDGELWWGPSGEAGAQRPDS